MKAKMKLKRLLSVLLTLAMVVGMMPAMGQVAYAESTLPTISNVVISSDGVLTWDAVEGAERYSISVATFGGYVDETSYNLKYQCNFYNTGSGTKKIHLVAKDAGKNDIAEWYGSYDYVDDRPQLDAPQNIQLNGPIISWDPVPNATYYVVNIIGDTGKRHQVTDTFYVYDDLADGNSYFFVVAAYALEYRGNGTEKTMVYRKVLYPITVTNGTAEDGYMRKLTEAEQGTYVILTADDVPEGSVFRGWRLGGVEVKEPKNKVISFTMPGNAVTATALYGIPYTVTVENGICTATGTSTGQFFEDDTVYVKAYDAPQGYQLKGWTSDDVTLPSGSILDISFTMPAKDVVIKAEYKPVSYIVTFDANGHGTAPKAQSVENGKTATKPKDLTADGWTFCGWYKDAECTEYFDFSTAITKDITLYASWTQGNTYTVKFDTNGHGTAPDSQRVKEGEKATRPAVDPTAEGWIFGGWYKSPNGNGFPFDFATETITEDITLYANWAHPYYVYFDANGGTGTMEPVAVYPGDWCTVPECGFTAPEGKQFKGWAFDANSTEVVQFTSFEVFGGNKTLYAIWENIPVTEYDISVTDGKATVGAGTEISKAAEGTTVTLTANAAPDGKVFDKWEVVSGSITLADATSATTTFTMPAGDVSVKATYKEYNPTFAFVTRIYTKLLNRAAESAGVDYWMGEILAGRTSCAQVVELFARSDEIATSGITNEELVNRVYLTMLDRAADEGGLNYWKSILDNGSTVSLVVAGFAGSAEFREICNLYGMEPGTITLSNPRDINTNVTAFVARCYTKALGRTYDIGGLESWCQLINSKQSAPIDTAKFFIFSEEFKAKNLSNAEYVKVLYRTFMGREADEAGLNYWVGELDAGRKTREVALDDFAYCEEFKKILESFGL